MHRCNEGTWRLKVTIFSSFIEFDLINSAHTKSSTRHRVCQFTTTWIQFTSYSRGLADRVLPFFPVSFIDIFLCKATHTGPKLNKLNQLHPYEKHKGDYRKESQTRCGEQKGRSFGQSYQEWTKSTTVSTIRYTDKSILDYIVSNTFPGFPALGEQNWLLWIKVFS
jgi:hypothetical protein